MGTSGEGRGTEAGQEWWGAGTGLNQHKLTLWIVHPSFAAAPPFPPLPPHVSSESDCLNCLLMPRHALVVTGNSLDAPLPRNVKGPVSGGGGGRDGKGWGSRVRMSQAFQVTGRCCHARYISRGRAPSGRLITRLTCVALVMVHTRSCWLVSG